MKQGISKALHQIAAKHTAYMAITSGDIFI